MNYDKILSDMYDNSCYLNNNGRIAESVHIFEQQAVQALNILGLTYCNAKKYDESIRCFMDALKIDPGNWILWSNITHVESTRENYTNGQIAAEKTIKYAKGYHADAYYNAGVIYTASNRPKEAEEMYRMALQLAPNNPHVNYNLGLMVLRQRICMEGWQKYEYRHETAPFIKKFVQRFLQDKWDGRKFKDKTLVVYSEQGLGDFIFFARFLPKVKQLGGKVILEVQEPLVDLVGKNFGVHEVVSRSNGNIWNMPPEGDYCISVCSLPLVFKIDSFDKIPNKPYIFAPDLPRPKEFNKKQFNIGLCYAGNSDHPRDHTRSMFLEHFAPIIKTEGVQVFNIMKNVNPIRNWPQGKVNVSRNSQNLPIIDLAPKISNMKDLSHYINHLDLVITVDSAVAHLAGAMGKPVWNLIGREVDWRWMDDTDKSHWYPSMKIFRYKNSWEELVKEVEQNIKLEILMHKN